MTNLVEVVRYICFRVDHPGLIGLAFSMRFNFRRHSRLQFDVLVQAPLVVTIRRNELWRRCVHTFESRPPLGKWVFLKHDKDRVFCLKFSRKGLVYVERREQVRLHYFETAQLWVAQDSSVAIGRIDENHLEVGVNHKGKMQFSVARRLDGDYADAPPARVRAVKSPQSPSYPLFPPPLRPAGYWEVQDEWS